VSSAADSVAGISVVRSTKLRLPHEQTIGDALRRLLKDAAFAGSSELEIDVFSGIHPPSPLIIAVCHPSTQPNAVSKIRQRVKDELAGVN
jgi:hypothetical protein